MNMDSFRNPSAEYRPVPFWSWNDLLEPEELRRQIREFAAQGFGGFFMHSRPGLETEYLSEEWFECVKACIDEAEKQGIKAWLYDEDKWPSGYGGGQVAPLGEDYRNKALCMAENSIPQPEDMVRILKVYRADRITSFNGGFASAGLSSKLVNLREIPADAVNEEIIKGSDISAAKTAEDGKVLTESHVILYFYQLTARPGDPWFNGASYVDLMNPDVTEAFIASTHERYLKAFGDKFGGAVPGIFTDEPHYLMQFRWGVRVLPWTHHLSELFEAEYGYGILDSLPLLFYPFEGYEKVRYDYRRLLDKLFLEGYTKRVYRWCGENGLKFTGHYMCEDDIVRNMDWVGSIMQHYEFMHYPGIDHLTRRADDIITQKQLQSVCCQLGKERALSETFACSGQNVSFEQLKWIADWQFVNGINLINPHLSSYSMRGDRKRDYPPNIFYQQPWWEYAGYLTGYFSRLSYILSQGERVARVLVIHPVESGFIAYSPLDVSGCQELNNSFEKTLVTLLENHYDFDLGDEGIIQRHGSVSGSELVVGRSRYSVVVVPPLLTLRSSTLELLRKFMDNGGKVAVLQRLPAYIDGKPGRKGIEDYLKAARLTAYHTLAETMKEMLEPEVAIELWDGSNGCSGSNGINAGKIFFHHRQIDGRSVYFFANNDSENDYECSISIKGMGDVTVLDPLTGMSERMQAQCVNGFVRFSHFFPRCGSLLVMLDTSAALMEGPCSMQEEAAAWGLAGQHEGTEAQGLAVRQEEAAWGLTVRQEEAAAWGLTARQEETATRGLARRNEEALDAEAEIINISLPWRLRVLEKNALTLDYCCLSIDGGEFGAPVHHLAALKEIKARRKPFVLRYSFEVKGWSGEGGELVMESPERFSVELNGRPVDFSGSGYWKDRSFRRVSIENMVQDGINVLEISSDDSYYTENTDKISKTIIAENVAKTHNTDCVEIESVYVIGDFKVASEGHDKFYLEPVKDMEFVRNLSAEGFPFYSGKAEIDAKININIIEGCRYVLGIDRLEAIAADISINGSKAGSIFWKPYELDITAYIKQGVNAITICFVNSLHNLLGPHHNVAGETAPSVGPGSFGASARWTDLYYFAPFGVEGVYIKAVK